MKNFDVLIIGAGVSGLYALHQLRQRGFKTLVLDQAPAIGGTWYWNRYPGCRFDSESPTYSYSFSPEILQEWNWLEKYSAQPDTERYLNYVADRLELRNDIQLSTTITSASWDSVRHRWILTTSGGVELSGQFLITAVGALSAFYVPPFRGLESFRGEWCHTGRWPANGLDLDGKRVGVVGTGATGVQLIPAIAPKVAHLTVFQRTPNYCVPLRNGRIDTSEMDLIKARYPDIFRICSQTPHGFLHVADPRSAMQVTASERLEFFEATWKLPGFAKFLCNFHDVMVPGPANEEYAKFVREKIRVRIENASIAETVIPTDHPFGSKRVPCETEYYEVYDRPNVSLKDVKASPIQEITPTGISTADSKHDLDVIIFATGYDAVTGALDRIEITGENGLTLKDKFRDGPRTFMGLQSTSFPNMFTVNVAGARNTVRIMEPLMDWVVNCIAHIQQAGRSSIVPKQSAEDAWTAHVIEAGAGMLRARGNSWYVGANIPGKPRFLLTTPDPAPVGRAQRAEIAATGYKEFLIS